MTVVFFWVAWRVGRLLDRLYVWMQVRTYVARERAQDALEDEYQLPEEAVINYETQRGIDRRLRGL